MRVIAPYVTLHARTRGALQAWPEVEYRYVGASDAAYSSFIREVWARGEDFTVCEHDMAPSPTLFDEFAACPHGFCATPYAWVTNIGPALGLTRFGADILARYPTAATEAASIDGGFGPGSWRTFDYWLMRLILEEKYGVVPHLHLPPAEHLNPDKQLAPQFQHLTLGEHLAKVGYRLADDGLSAEWVGRPRRAVRPQAE